MNAINTFKDFLGVAGTTLKSLLFQPSSIGQVLVWFLLFIFLPEVVYSFIFTNAPWEDVFYFFVKDAHNQPAEQDANRGANVILFFHIIPTLLLIGGIIYRKITKKSTNT